MNSGAKHIFIFICIFSLFSLTLQASVISVCKESKVFKNQSSPVSEEEEESQDSDESIDEEVFFVDDQACNYSSQNILKLTWAGLNINYPYHSKTIFGPPPKH